MADNEYEFGPGEGYDLGFTEGKEEGYNDGHEAGYDEGRDSRQDEINSLTDRISELEGVISKVYDEVYKIV